MSLHVQPADELAILTMERTGPASYPTGGFEIDLSATFRTIVSVDLVIQTPGANLPPGHFEIDIDTPTPGKATVRWVRHRFDDLQSVDGVSGQPAGVTVQAAAGATTDTESGHTHGIGTITTGTGSAHTHAVDLPNFTATSTAGSSPSHTHGYTHTHVFDSSDDQSLAVSPTTGLGGNAADDAAHHHSATVGPITVTSTAESAHTHAIDHDHDPVASDPESGHNHTPLTGAPGTGTAHAHVDNNIYQHQHAVSHTETNFAAAELPNATNLSGATFRLLAIGMLA